MRFVLIFALALVSCRSGHYSKAELTGRYVISVDRGIDTIELNRNGTYTHRFKTKDGFTDHQEGIWDLEALQGGATVVLRNFRPLLGENVRGEGTYLLRVRSSFGSISLITNIDLGEGYRRDL